MMRVRVVCGLGETMAIFSPISRLSSVLLPTFGRPMSAANPECWTVIEEVVWRRPAARASPGMQRAGV